MKGRILITGALGQIGTELASALRQRYGADQAAGRHRLRAGGAGAVPGSGVEIGGEGDVATTDGSSNAEKTDQL